ncbi:leucine-rich repeat protein [Clostridium luticellarii]|jgi:hypothetical protein|uniref:leucine-rich repeat protein n=1 Tax=Clostridium luticellarii TaxID=1691940 RepID=UPI002352FA78|nr:leucine-rich repeat protein [Clostridium luticellarii]MCI1944759.1 leucine-rich repeat protein [Clostridium luticellarii]MCI1968254.1 leucine-rich repeat protein [Clostridium luticellarii]
MLREKIKMLLCASMVCSMMFAAVDTLNFNQVLAEDSNADTTVVNMAETSENSKEPVTINNVQLKNKLAEAAGKGSDYVGDLTEADLASITGDIDLSNLDITDDDMPIMKYLTGVSGINLSNNAAITYVGFNKDNFDWTEPKDLNFSGCTGIKCSNQSGQGQSAFEGCSNLNSIVLPENISYLSTSMFKGTGLTSITIPDTVADIGDGAFQDCANLKEINLGNELDSIGDNAFNGTAITYLKIPGSVTGLGGSCFSNTKLNILDIRELPARLVKPIKMKRWGIPSSTVILYGQDINLSSDKLNLKSGDTQTITYNAQIPDGKNLTWGSINPDVATVSENGEITAVSPGTSFVYATTELISSTEIPSTIDPSTTYSGLCKVTVTGTDVKSSNADLSSLVLSGVALNENFDPAVMNYTASVSNEVASTDITAAAADPKSTIKLSVNGEDVSGQQASLNVGGNNIKVEVTAEDGTVKTYSIVVTRTDNSETNPVDITTDLPEGATFKLGSDARVTVNAINNSDEEQPVSLILALFNKDNNGFVTYTAGQQDVESKGTTVLTGGIKLPDTGNYELRAFVWDGLDAMKPLSDVITIPVVTDK